MELRIAIDKVNGGYLLQPVNSYYSAYGEPSIVTDFMTLVKLLADRFKEEDFSRTIESSQALTKVFAEFITCSVAPQLKAIECKVNPGLENVVDDDDIKF
jgi:hypothetical protein